MGVTEQIARRLTPSNAAPFVAHLPPEIRGVKKKRDALLQSAGNIHHRMMKRQGFGDELKALRAHFKRGLSKVIGIDPRLFLGWEAKTAWVDPPTREDLKGFSLFAEFFGLK